MTPFYQSMGFQQMETVHKLVRSHGYDLKFSGVLDAAIDKFAEGDLPYFAGLDQSACGCMFGRGPIMHRSGNRSQSVYCRRVDSKL